MESESIVYGCIRDWPAVDSALTCMRRQVNRRVLGALPENHEWSLLGAQMFACPEVDADTSTRTQIIHFGASYPTVEYEWGRWIQQFEALLKRLYWTCAVVHLETELNGTHTFRWTSDGDGHCPQSGELRVRCAWEREGGLRGA